MRAAEAVPRGNQKFPTMTTFMRAPGARRRATAPAEAVPSRSWRGGAPCRGRPSTRSNDADMMNQPSWSRNSAWSSTTKKAAAAKGSAKSAPSAQEGEQEPGVVHEGEGEAALEERHQAAHVELAPAAFAARRRARRPNRAIGHEVAAEPAAEDVVRTARACAKNMPASKKRSFSQVSIPAAPPL